MLGRASRNLERKKLTRVIFTLDLPALSALVEQDERWNEEDFIAWLTARGHRGLARFVGYRLVGFVLYSIEGGAETIEIHRVFVDPDLRRRGHGSALLWSAIESLTDVVNRCGTDRVDAWVSETNQPAIEFLIANGFQFSRESARETHIVDRMVRDEFRYCFALPPRRRKGA